MGNLTPKPSTFKQWFGKQPKTTEGQMELEWDVTGGGVADAENGPQCSDAPAVTSDQDEQ